MNGDWALLSWWVGCGAAAVALGVVALAFFRDRARGRRRCPSCWYDMSGGTGMTCPECGRTQKKERGFFRTRRRWRGVAVGMVLLVVGSGTAVAPALYTGKWAAYTPVPVLRWMLSFFEKDAARVKAKWLQRKRVTGFTSWERLLLAHAFAEMIQGEIDHPTPKPVGQTYAWINVRGSVEDALYAAGGLGDEARPMLPELALYLRLNQGDLVVAVHEKLGRVARDNAGVFTELLMCTRDTRLRGPYLRALIAMEKHARVAAEIERLLADGEATRALQLDTLAVALERDAGNVDVLTPLKEVARSGMLRERITAVRMIGLLAHSKEMGNVASPDGCVNVDTLFDDLRKNGFPTKEPVAGAVDAIRDLAQEENFWVRSTAEDVLKGVR